MEFHVDSIQFNNSVNVAKIEIIKYILASFNLIQLKLSSV